MLNRLRLAILLVALPACASNLQGDPRDDASMPRDAASSDGALPWLDAGGSDAGHSPTTDAGLGNAGSRDAGPGDAGPGDAGPRDAGPRDAGPADAGPADAGPADAGPDPHLCPPGRFASGTAHFHYDLDPRDREILDLTIAAPLFRESADRPIIPFPWTAHSHPQIVSMPESQYVAMRIDVPASLPVGWTGSIAQNETAPGPLIELAISRYCGDFAPADESCHHLPRSLGGLGLRWKIAGDPTAGCALTPGESYYLNIRFKHPLSSTESPYYCNASGTRCKLTLAQYSWPP